MFIVCVYTVQLVKISYQIMHTLILSLLYHLLYYSYLKELVPVINQCMDKFLDNLESSAQNKTPVSLRDEFALLTLNVISKVSS